MYEFEVCVPATHPAIPGHFPGNPIVPGVVLLDMILAQLEHLAGCRVVYLRDIKFVNVLRPHDRAVARCDVGTERASFRAFVRLNGADVPLARGTVHIEFHRTDEALDR